MKRIVIFAGPFFKHYPEVEVGRYFTDCLIRLIRENPGVEFHCLPSPFFRHSEWADLPLRFLPVRGWLDGSSLLNPLGYWQVSRALAKLGADALLSVGLPLPGSFTIPHFIWIPGRAGDEFMKNNATRVKKAAGRPVFYIAESRAQKDRWASEYSLPAGKIRMVPPACHEAAAPLSWSEKEQVKVKYAGGREFFLSRSHFSETQLLTLLKAFSFFKKRQQTQMNLVLAGQSGEADHAPYEKLETYKYRNDVQVYAGLAEEEFARLQASAYGLLLPAPDMPAAAILNAFNQQVPVIAGENPAWEAGIREAVVLTDLSDHEKLAGDMIRLFTNENYRSAMIRNGELQAGIYPMQQAVAALWHVLQADPENQHPNPSLP